MSPEAPPTVTLNIDGRDVTVPAGTGLVEAAASVDIEIPVFCYEPRIGPAVGACRMCMVEIEGMPKMQTACSTGVRDGMVVSTVSERTRTAQEAVLEFLLINHPLDCPVCDKGGECPLQDQTLRWGPGASRFIELKRTIDKPIPISPLITLDRERCIFCYRCTRFSNETSGDNQLIARERGAKTVISTFEGRPYDAHFSGNVIELCPVGALTSSEYRFKGRPWENTDHPGVCMGCAVGCNTYSSVREGQVARVIARENTDVDNGWLCDRGRFAYPSMYVPERIVAPQLRGNRDRSMGNRPMSELSHEVAMEWMHDKLASPAGDGARELWVLSGSETLETAFAIQQIAAQTGGRVVAVPGASAAVPEHGASLADLRHAKHILIIGDADLVDVAANVDIRVRDAVKDGAKLTVAGVGGSLLEQAGGSHEMVTPGAGGVDAWVDDLVARIGKVSSGGTMTQAVVIIYRDGDVSPAARELLAKTFQIPREGSGFIALARAANARGLAALGIEPAPWDEILSSTGGVVYMGVDPSRHVADTEWMPALKRAAWVACIDTLPTPLHPGADLVIPGVFSPEQEGSTVNLEGRLQRFAEAAEAPAETRRPLTWLAGLGRRMGAKLPGHAAGAFRVLAASDSVVGHLPAATYADIPDTGVLGVTGGASADADVAATTDMADAPTPVPADGTYALFVSPFLYDANDVAYTPRMQFLRDEARVAISREDARALGVANGGAVIVTINGVDVPATANMSRRITSGYLRMHAGTPGLAAGHAGWRTASVRPVATEA